MTDSISLANMRFWGHHGALEHEREQPQPFEVDVELYLDLRAAGLSDELSETIDYRGVFDVSRRVVEGPSCSLIEALAERIAAGVLSLPGGDALSEVVVRVRKPEVDLGGALDGAAVEIRRRP